jgi:ASPIC and UnbV/FG-GAP-like repeat/Secretion system C-terminal sorting domain
MKKILLSAFSFISLLCLEAQTYDTCAAADASSSISPDTVYTVGTIDGDLPPIFCEGTGSNVDGGEWVKYIPDDDYEVTVSSDLSQNGDKDTRVQVFKGDCGTGVFTCVGGDDDDGVFDGSNGNSYLSVAVFEVEVGETYYIVWDDKWTNSSNFDFILTEEDPTPPPPPTPVTFTQQTINTTGSYDQAIVDMNGDHLDDVVSVNDGSNSFINIHYQLPGGGFNDVTIATSEPAYSPFWSIAAGDINADGYNDLLYGDGNGVSFMIANSNGTAYNEFSINEYVFSQRSNFVDVNNDGNLDAFVCHDVDESLTYLNQGPSNNYALVSSNTNGLGGYPNGGNYASIWIDYDNDRDIDMFMAKCGGSIERRTNELYRNNGDGTYTEVAAAANMADPIQTWSAAWGDFDNDGDMDAYVGSSDFDDPNTLMRNNGDGTFTNVTTGAGVDTAAKGYENIAADFDNDGNLDIFTNGNMLFGNGDLTFTYNPNLSLPNSAYGGSIGDLNNDGFLDMFGSNNIYINSGNANNWIKIVTEGMAHSATNRSNRNGIGARVEISTPSGVQIRDVRSGEGFRYMHTMNTHFGIGTDTTINYIRIYWPSGVVDNINNPTINSAVVVQEGQSLSLNDTLVDDLIIYPNPTTGIININASYGFDTAIYTVFDISGKRILNGKFSENTINVTNIASGNYILRIMNEGQIKSQKFIKK